LKKREKITITKEDDWVVVVVISFIRRIQTIIFYREKKEKNKKFWPFREGTQTRWDRKLNNFHTTI
jgi:hypothetical protein